ncbi:insulinase family protein [bacterium]|nr:insulinase family protein [bacterium]
MQKLQLKNGINVKFIESPETPRIALTLFLAFSEPDNTPGLMTVLNRLLLQGTKTRTAEQLANELDENAIELYCELKNDYMRLRVLSLNEDFEYSLELLEDIIKNSTFENFDKEVEKLKGELTAELDSARAKAQDNYYNTIFANHPYGIGSSQILENIDNIKKEEVKNKFSELLANSKKNICVVGDIDFEKVKTLVEKYFGDLPNSAAEINSDKYILNQDKISTVTKEDANQAQIHKGWILPPIFSEDRHKFMLLNTVLGAGGMTSRLFYELREKKGLAYVVRSMLETNAQASCFTVYIATEPKNIQTCLDGFKTEIDKIMNVPLTDEELEDAKNNLIGRRQFYYETNLLKATMKGLQGAYNFPDDCEETFVKKIQNTTKEELQECAKRCFSTPSVLSVLAPSEFLKSAGLEKK